MKTKIKSHNYSRGTFLKKDFLQVLVALIVIFSLFAPANYQKTAFAATLLSVNFNSTTDGFVYQDDSFGTTQPNYASGTRSTTGGYSGTGGLQVTLGGIDATVINGMSGAWTYTLDLAAAESGVKLSFRYKLDQGVAYEFDEYSRVLVKVDSTQYGRGAKNYVDHIGGDGSSSQGNSSTYVVTTDWQQVDIYLGSLSAGNHTIVLGTYNNQKDASDESTTLVIDDVSLTSGNAVPPVTPGQTLAGRVSISQFLAYNQGIAQFDDRCRGSGMSCSSYDASANPSASSNYMKALAWVESQLQGMGYTTVRHPFTSGTGGINLYATKMGSVTPTEMYMISGHLDGRSGGDGFDDDGSAVALLLEIARVLSAPDVTTDKSVRFIFWDKEETGLVGSTAYASNTTSTGGRRALQGTLDEPTWLGLITHDMILYDHGAGTRTTAQSAYADLDVEFRAGTTKEADSKALALKWRYAAGLYAPDYPANTYSYSTNTDDTPFHPYVASISVRENRRNLTSGTNAEWINPYYHTTSDVESSYTRDDDGDGKRDDIELGYNAVRVTLGLISELAGAHVGPANNPPTANPQSASTNEDTAKAITLTGSDPDGNPLTYALVTNPGHGTLSGTAPNLTYTPAANYNGGDSFTFKVNDGTVNSSPATVSLTITAVNDTPVANPQSATTNEDTAKAITLTGSDVDGNPLTYSVTGSPSHGALSGTAPNLTYTPAANYNGADSFTFKVNDGTVDSAPATVSLTVTAVNDAPLADAQSLSTPEDTANAITLTGSDMDENPLTYSVTGAPSHGSLSGTAPNLTYTPAADYNGPDSFAFVTNDGSVNSAPATVSLTITPVNDTPVANNQDVVTSQDVPVALTLTGSDVDGDTLSFAVLAGPLNGVLSGTAPDLTYTPNLGFVGDDSFTFEANDAQSSSPSATVSVTVTRTNHQPAADAQSVVTAEDTTLAIVLTGSDPDSDPLSFVVTVAPAHGALSGTAPNLAYTPAANYNGPDSFQFVANDGLVDSLAATVSIDIAPVNDAPLANAQSVTVAEDSSVAVTLTGSDVDGDVLSFSVVDAPAHGVLSGTAPNLIYTPAANYNGPDSFTFLVNDGTVDSALAAVSLTVTAVNDAPLANPQSIATYEDTAKAVTLTGSDVEANPLTFSVVVGPAHGALSGTAPNLTYTPAANYNGADSFTFKANDGQADSAPAAVAITVNAVNDAPVANAQSVTTTQDTAKAITLTGSDVEGSALSFSIVTNPTHGALSGTAPNLTYTPAAGYSGSDSFTFKVNDGTIDSLAATVSITVNPSGPVTVFSDTFESSLGWTRNPSGTDTATLGLWERANPESTSSSGTKQMGTTVSGSFDLVTGPLAGSSAGSYDIDGGLTSMRSPNIVLPSGKTLTLSLKYYLAHGSNSSSSDYLRIKVVGATTTTILQELGANNDDDAAWATLSVDISSYAGQTVYILIEAADASGASLVEAAIDDLLIKAQ